MFSDAPIRLKFRNPHHSCTNNTHFIGQTPFSFLPFRCVCMIHWVECYAIAQLDHVLETAVACCLTHPCYIVYDEQWVLFPSAIYSFYLTPQTHFTVHTLTLNTWIRLTTVACSTQRYVLCLCTVCLSPFIPYGEWVGCQVVIAYWLVVCRTLTQQPFDKSQDSGYWSHLAQPDVDWCSSVVFHSCWPAVVANKCFQKRKHQLILLIWKGLQRVI